MLCRYLLVFGLLGTLLGVCACASLLNSATSLGDISVRNGLRHADGGRGTYDIYVPGEAGPNTPIVVFFYGGSWVSGDKERYLFVGQSLAAAGVIVAIPDYRLYPEVTFPGFVEDGARAVAAVLEMSRKGGSGVPAGAHPIFLMGHSAGAHIAALLGYDGRYLRSAGVPASAIAGLVGLAGPYDFLPLTSDRNRRIFPPETHGASQPVDFVDASDPPALLISGVGDETVRPSNSQSLARKIQQAGGRAELGLYRDVSHIGAVVALATAIDGDSEIREAVLAFIRRHSTPRRTPR